MQRFDLSTKRYLLDNEKLYLYSGIGFMIKIIAGCSRSFMTLLKR
jgi:hypothetical protein